MRTPFMILAGTLLAVTPVLAQDNLNVEQPSHITTQSGQTSGGPIDTGPYSGGSAGVVYGGPPIVEDIPLAGGPGYAVDPGPGPGGVLIVPVR